MKRDDWAVDRTGKERFFRDEELTMEIDGSQITDEQLAEICGAVILVRCKDCKFWNWEKGGAGETGTCGEIDGMIKPGPDDFCSRGRRKE